MDELVRVQDEIRQGNFVSAETILDTILDRPDEMTSHFLFDLTNAYEELFKATNRYEDHQPTSFTEEKVFVQLHQPLDGEGRWQFIAKQ